jgi:hypothetical protein
MRRMMTTHRHRRDLASRFPVEMKPSPCTQTDSTRDSDPGWTEATVESHCRGAVRTRVTRRLFLECGAHVTATDGARRHSRR